MQVRVTNTKYFLLEKNTNGVFLKQTAYKKTGAVFCAAEEAAGRFRACGAAANAVEADGKSKRPSENRG